jgi:hypothetical protein
LKILLKKPIVVVACGSWGFGLVEIRVVIW